MKVKFTKLAALLLAGVALFATGCTDYEVDIQKVDKKVDELISGKVASLEQQVANLNATVATLETQAKHDEDIKKLTNTISELEKALTEDLNSAKARIAALEAADENFKQQIKALQDTDKDHAAAIELINGEISGLKTRLDAAEAAIKKINEETIPAIQAQIKNIEELVIPKLQQDIADLQSGKLDKATFEEYKTATAGTLALMQEAIQDLADLTAGFPEGKTIKEYIDGIADEFSQKYAEVISKAFGSEAKMKEMEGNLLGRLEACEDLLEGEWGDKTVKEYLDGEVASLQGQIDDIVNTKIPEIEGRIAALEKNVNEVILPQLQFAIGYEGVYSEVGGLQGYIDDAAYQAYLDACDYAYDLAVYLMDHITDLYYTVTAIQQRIQSIVFVPDYDDLKITSNMAYVSQPVEGEKEVEVLVMDQPSKVTYKILPAQYAVWAAAHFEDILQFDIKPVDTRADGDAEEVVPEMVILDYEYDAATVDETGEITFTFLPANVASAAFAANAIKPNYSLEIYTQDGSYIQGGSAATMYTDEMYFGGNRLPDNYDMNDWVLGVYSYEDLKAYEARAAFAASLRLKYFEGGTAFIHYLLEDFDGEYDEDFPEYNEVASTYNVLYPAVDQIEILPDPYKKEDDGDIRPFTEDEVWQKLPYSSLREGGVDAEGNPVTPNIGEIPEQDPKGYRIILDQAVPAVSINGGEPMSLEAAAKAGYVLPNIETEFKEFVYSDKTGGELPAEREENFVETNKVYAEIEMNPKKSASSRKMEVGDIVTGTYEFVSALGKFPFWGHVIITKPQGTIEATSNIVWTYSLDANVDHNLWVKDYKGTQAVETVEGGEVYNRTALAVAIDSEDAADLEKNLGVTLEDFRKATPVDGSLKITTTDETGAVVTVDTITFPGEYPVKIDADGNLTVDIAGFEWDKEYTVTADYELDSALITVTWTITTVDRNREVITIELPEYAFDLNGEDYDADADTYTSKPQDFLEKLFAAFVDQKIINQEEVKDYEAADDFKGDGTAGIGGKEGHLTRYFDEEGKIPETDSPYVICGDDYALFYKVTSEQLHEVWEAGEAQVRNVLTFIGQQVEIIWPVTVNIPNYDFLHLRFYTFNTKREAADFITKLDFAAKQEGKADVEWWSQVYPSYYTDQAAEGEAVDPDNRVSNRYALADYDVAYINLAELAFNVVDENDEPMTDEQIEEEKLVVKFDYTWENQGVKPLPTVDQLLKGNPVIENYEDLWMAPTTFYYRTNEYEFIPVNGTLAILSGNTEFEIKTRFQKNERNSVKYPSEALDYSSYAVVRWTPFKVPPTVNNIEIVLDENKVYYEPLFKGMNLMDNRPNGVSFPVIVDGEWVMGDAAEDATADSKSNGYIEGVRSDVAYHIDPVFDFSTVELPVELQKLLTLKYFDGQQYIDEKDATDEQKKTLPPYIVFDYSSQIQFHGVVTVPISVVLENPWQEAIPFDYNLVIKGLGD